MYEEMNLRSDIIDSGRAARSGAGTRKGRRADGDRRRRRDTVA